MKPLLLLLFLLPLQMVAQDGLESDNGPLIGVRATFASSLIADLDEALLSYGVGAQARLSQKFTLGLDVTFGTDDRLNYTMIHPHLRYYPYKPFKGFFLRAGFGYTKFNARGDRVILGGPFNPARGASAGVLTVDAGLGVSTIVKDHWTIGLSASLVGSFDSDISETGLLSSVSVGYAF